MCAAPVKTIMAMINRLTPAVMSPISLAVSKTVGGGPGATGPSTTVDELLHRAVLNSEKSKNHSVDTHPKTSTTRNR